MDSAAFHTCALGEVIRRGGRVWAARALTCVTWAPKIVPARGAPMLGKTVSHYRILEKLGGGGMGVVYTAEDAESGPFVVLMLLPEKCARKYQAPAQVKRQEGHSHVQ